MTRDVLWNVPSQVERFVAIYYNKYFAICIQFLDWEALPSAAALLPSKTAFSPFH